MRQQHRVYRVTLERAAEALGGEQFLAAYLDVPRERLRWWLEGSASVPEDVFLKLVDMLLEGELAHLKATVSHPQSAGEQQEPKQP